MVFKGVASKWVVTSVRRVSLAGPRPNMIAARRAEPTDTNADFGPVNRNEWSQQTY